MLGFVRLDLLPDPARVSRELVQPLRPSLLDASLSSESRYRLTLFDCRLDPSRLIKILELQHPGGSSFCVFEALDALLGGSGIAQQVCQRWDTSHFRNDRPRPVIAGCEVISPGPCQGRFASVGRMTHRTDLRLGRSALESG